MISEACAQSSKMYLELGSPSCCVVQIAGPRVYDHGAAMEEFTVKELVCSKDVSLRRDTCNFESRRPDLRLMLGLLRRCSWSDPFLVTIPEKGQGHSDHACIRAHRKASQ